MFIMFEVLYDICCGYLLPLPGGQEKVQNFAFTNVKSNPMEREGSNSWYHYALQDCTVVLIL